MGLRLCLVGQGIAGSPSPAMQAAALRAAGVAGRYELRDIDPGALPAFMGEMRSGRYDGCNVTIPHKAAAAALCDALEGDAAALGVCNTITAAAGLLRGANTDSDGFRLALRRAALWPKAGARAVVFGAGGAAAAVALALARLPAGRLTFVARSRRAATSVARRAVADVPTDVVGWTLREAAGALAQADLVVNATPIGLHDLPLDIRTLPASCTVADVRYRPRPVDLVAAAARSGRPACDGVDMLLCQGMLSFGIWTGREPPWEAARAALMAALTS